MAIISHTTLRGARIYSPEASYDVSYLVVAGGGGGGGSFSGGGGGAGGFRTGTGLSLATSTNYTVTVGAGGAGSTIDGAANAVLASRAQCLHSTHAVVPRSGSTRAGCQGAIQEH